jgi:hypothetical protein
VSSSWTYLVGILASQKPPPSYLQCGNPAADKKQLYCGNNLDVLRRYVREESVDLVYLDPRFNSRQDYNLLFAEKDGSRRARRFMRLKIRGSGTSTASARMRGLSKRAGAWRTRFAPFIPFSATPT